MYSLTITAKCFSVNLHCLIPYLLYSFLITTVLLLILMGLRCFTHGAFFFLYCLTSFIMVSSKSSQVKDSSLMIQTTCYYIENIYRREALFNYYFGHWSLQAIESSWFNIHRLYISKDLFICFCLIQCEGILLFIAVLHNPLVTSDASVKYIQFHFRFYLHESSLSLLVWLKFVVLFKVSKSWLTSLCWFLNIVFLFSSWCFFFPFLLFPSFY